MLNLILSSLRVGSDGGSRVGTETQFQLPE